MKTTTELKKEINRYIREKAKLEHLDDDEDIFATGVVNSLFTIQLMTWLEKEYRIKITMEDLDMSHFRTPGSIAHFTEKKLSSDGILAK